jgi:hypothetical protein
MWGQLPWLYDSDEALAAATALLTETPPPDEATLFAALDVYAHGGSETAPIEPHLQHASGSIRATAAAALLARGDAAGFPPLLAEIRTRGAWHPAARALARWTADGTLGPPLDADDDQLADATARLDAWWAAKGKALRFDGSRWRSA